MNPMVHHFHSVKYHLEFLKTLLAAFYSKLHFVVPECKNILVSESAVAHSV